MLTREKYPDTDVYVFYIDVRTPGKNFDEFYRRAVEEYGVHYIKGMVGKVAPHDGKLIVQASDLIMNEQLHIEADLVVLAAAIEPDKIRPSSRNHADRQHGHKRLLHRGSPEAPSRRKPHRRRIPLRSMPGTEGHSRNGCTGQAAAAKVIGLLSKDKLTCNPCVAHSNEMMCNGCSTCANVCPYGAISYVDKEFRMPDRTTKVPDVSLRLTRRYARAAAPARSPACPAQWTSRAFQQTNYGGGRRDMQIENKEFTPKIVAFCCNWCSYAGADLAGTNRLNYPANVKIIRVPCSCRVNPMFILRAFQRGADGVIMCGCHPGDCHYTSGNYYARRRMTLLFSMLDYLGIERDRTRVEWVSAAEGAKFAHR